MKIDECLTRLKSAIEAIESAPQKGFVNLDMVNNIMQETRSLLESVSPRLMLGEKLTADIKAGMLNKLNTLKFAGGGALLSQAEQAIEVENLDYDRLKLLQKEIDAVLDQVFSGQTKALSTSNCLKQTHPPKREDYN